MFMYQNLLLRITHSCQINKVNEINVELKDKHPEAGWRKIAIRLFSAHKLLIYKLLWNHYISWGLHFCGFRGYHQPRIYILNK